MQTTCLSRLGSEVSAWEDYTLLKVSYYESIGQANTSVYAEPSPYTSASGRCKSRICLTLSLISTTGIMNITKDLYLTPYLTLRNGTQIDATKELEDYGYRTMWDIFRSCALTILACTWATIHSNIASSSHRCSPSNLYYKVQLWVVALIMPDMMLLWSAKQFFAARRLVTRKGLSRHRFPRPFSP